MIEEKTMEQIAREEIIRQTLESAAVRLESYSTNEHYRKALKLGAKMLREMKP